MQIVINIPEEQIKKSLEESKYIHEDEGEKGSVNIAMLYTNGQLDFVDVSRKTDFYSCKYKILPKGHGRILDEKDILDIENNDGGWYDLVDMPEYIAGVKAIIEADKESENKG